MRIYDFFDGDPEAVIPLKQHSLHAFEAGLDDDYQQRFGRAAEAFREVLAIHPSDRMAQLS